jgi:hypothetical protein
MSSWSHRIAGSQSLALLTAVLVIGLLVGPIPAAAEEGATPVATPAGAAPESVDPSSQVKEWIDQLGSDQFAQREAASRSLAEAGLPALKALTGAIHGDDLEVASRAIEIVRRFLEGGDEALAVEAEKLVEAIAEGPDTPVSSLAIAMLDFHHLGMVEAAREKLESLGAIITEGFITTGSRGLIVMLNSNWQGGADDLRLLTRLRGVVQVGLRGVRLDEKALAVLGRLRGVESFQVYGTGISAEALAALAAKHPDAEIDFRKGGKLGVGGQPMAGPCLITMVQEESAAAKAGLQIGDIVVKIDGEPVANFEALTDRVGQHGPGEKIELDIERNFPGDKPQRFSRTIALDGWD